MKKLISMILTLAMIFSLSITALAVDNGGAIAPGQSAEIGVEATYSQKEADAPVAVYSVTIAWEKATDHDLTFTKNGTAYVWNPNELKYEAAATQEKDGWTGKASYKITTTNRSNAGLVVAYSVNAVDGITLKDVAGTDDLPVESAAAGITPGSDGTGTVKTGVSNITFGVESGSITAENVTVANITVTLSAADGE